MPYGEGSAQLVGLKAWHNAVGRPGSYSQGSGTGQDSLRSSQWPQEGFGDTGKYNARVARVWVSYPQALMVCRWSSQTELEVAKCTQDLPGACRLSSVLGQ